MTVEESRLGGGVDGRCREPHPCFRTHSPPPRVFAVSLISAMASVVFLFVLVSVFAAGAHASSEEPNIPDSCALLEPVHNESTPLASSFPGAITIAMDTDIYELGATVEITISGGGSSTSFSGFIIQAREAGQPLSTATYGTFTTIAVDPKTKALTCFNPNDTAGHANSDAVSFVRVLWSATELPTELSQIQFFVTVVESFEQFWVRIPSDRINTTSIQVRNYAILKSHGSLMVIAWTLFVPVGIMLALFYKVIWPNGEWFYSHIAIMCAAIVLVLVGLILAIVYAGGRWLTTTSLNNPHQVFGIIAVVAIVVNPFLAIIRCDPESQWRFIYNWSHGLIGLIFAQGAAMAAMLLGLNVMRELPELQSNFVHYAIYMVSASVGLIISVIIFYNLYTVNYDKNFQTDGSQIAPSASEPPGSFPEHNYDDDEEKETSRDYPLRAGVGITVIVLLLVFTVLAIIFIGLA